MVISVQGVWVSSSRSSRPSRMSSQICSCATSPRSGTVTRWKLGLNREHYIEKPDRPVSHACQGQDLKAARPGFPSETRGRRSRSGDIRPLVCKTRQHLHRWQKLRG
jgi:hypothetical protein